MYKLAVAVVCTLTIAASARADITAGEKGPLPSPALDQLSALQQAFVGEVG